MANLSVSNPASRAGVAIVLLGLMVPLGASADAPARAQRLRAPEHIARETQADLDARMSRHGETMSNLVARTSTSARDRKRLPLPPEFSAEQTRLSAAARELAVAAAEANDDRVLAERFAAVTSTCVTCHSVYLHGRPGPQPLGPKGR